MKRLAALVVLAMAVPAAADPSFDCAKASSAVEKAICSEDNPGLALQDGALGRLFAALKREGGHDAILASQREWLKRRDACGADVNCLTRRYDERLQILAREAGDRLGATGIYRYQLTGESSEEGSNAGEAYIFYEPGGALSGSISTVSGPTYHTCEVGFDGGVAEGASWRWTDTETSSMHEGQRCTVTFTPGRNSMKIESEYCRDYCGARGYFDEVYKKMK